MTDQALTDMGHRMVAMDADLDATHKAQQSCTKAWEDAEGHLADELCEALLDTVPQWPRKAHGHWAGESLVLTPATVTRWREWANISRTCRERYDELVTKELAIQAARGELEDSMTLRELELAGKLRRERQVGDEAH